MTTEIPRDWLDTGLAKDELDEHTIKNDRWDRKYYDQMLSQLGTFAGARDSLVEFTTDIGTPTGEAATADTFFSIFKADPHIKEEGEVKPTHLINRAVQQEFSGLADRQRLRRFTVNDDVQAALSFASIEPDIETLFDKLRQEQKQADEFAETLAALAGAGAEAGAAQHDLDEMMAAMKAAGQGEPSDGKGEDGDGNGLTEEQQDAIDAKAKRARELGEKFEELKAQAAEQAEALEEALHKAQPQIAVQLREMMNKACTEAQQDLEAALAWGLDPGTLHRLPAEERIELAKKLKSPRFRKIADRIGPMRNMMWSEQQRKTTKVKEELTDTELGNDLSRLVPSELSALSHPLLKRNFLRKFMSRGLMQYQMEGNERLARGGIIFCEDGSGSMSGDREMWAKAVMLCLLDLAKTQRRTMHVIHFGSPGQFQHIGFTKPEHFTFERIVEAAELFFNGGTDFHTPMKEALKILEAEFVETGGVQADVVFITDDECGVDPEFMEDYLLRMKKMQSTTWGVTVNPYPPRDGGPLYQMAEGKVAMVKDFLSGDDIRSVFRGV